MSFRLISATLRSVSRIAKRDNYDTFTPEELQELKISQSFLDTQLKIECYMKDLMRKAGDINTFNVKTIKAVYKNDILNYLKSYPDHVTKLSNEVQLLLQKHSYAAHVLSLLKNTEHSLPQRFKQASQYLQDPVVSKTLDTNYGIWAWICRLLHISSNDAKFSQHIHRQCRLIK